MSIILGTEGGASLKVGTSDLARFTNQPAGAAINLDKLTQAAVTKMNTFTGWLTANSVPGYLGETGWPNTTDNALWQAIGEAVYSRADMAGLWVTYWATGDKWGQTYPLLAYKGSPVDTALAPSSVIEAHLGDTNALRGINVAGGEFYQSGFSAASPGTYGTDYSYGSLSTYTYLASRGLTLIRIPFRWERLQPIPGATLDATGLGYLTTAIGWAAAAGLKVILDCHNYGAFIFAGPSLSSIGSTELTVGNFADLWSRLSTVFKDDTTVVGYALMNEPQGLSAPGETYETPTVRYSFDSNITGWGTINGEVWSSSQGGSMRVTPPMGTSAETVTSLRDRSSGGLTFWADVYIDSGATGTWDVALQSRDAGYSFLRTEYRRLVKGQVNRLRLTLTSSQAAAMRDLEISWGGSGRNSTDYAYVLGVWQGTYVASGGPVDQWISASQAAADAIRATGDTTEVCVAPYFVYGEEPWGVTHPIAWVSETGIRYESHLYYDYPASGAYGDSYATDLAAIP